MRKYFVSDNLFEESTLVIANALYFKGNWKVSFDPKQTSMKCFSVANLGCKMVPMMQKADTLNYNMILDLDAHAVEIPYEVMEHNILTTCPDSRKKNSVYLKYISTYFKGGSQMDHETIL